MALLTLILKIIKLFDKSISNKNNDSKLASSKNNNNKWIFEKNNSNKKIEFDDNSMEYAKKLGKSKYQKLSKSKKLKRKKMSQFWNLSKLRKKLLKVGIYLILAI